MWRLEWGWMGERWHKKKQSRLKDSLWWQLSSICLCLSPPIYLSIYYLSLPFVYISIYHSLYIIYIFIYLPSIYQNIIYLSSLYRAWSFIVMFLRCIHVIVCINSFFFLLLCGKPLCEFALIFLICFMLMYIWVVSSLGIFWIQLL